MTHNDEYPDLENKKYSKEEKKSVSLITNTKISTTELNLDEKDLTIIPNEIKQLINLTSLSLNQNKISGIIFKNKSSFTKLSLFFKPITSTQFIRK